MPNQWKVGHNAPGYLPDSEPVTLTDWKDAQTALVNEIERGYEDIEWEDHHTNDLEALYVGYVEALTAAQTATETSPFVEISFNGHSYFIIAEFTDQKEEIAS